MGTAETVHGWWLDNRWGLPASSRMGRGGRRHLCHRTSSRESTMVPFSPLSLIHEIQKAKVTIAVAVLSIYAVDFSINAGMCLLNRTLLPESNKIY